MSPPKSKAWAFYKKIDNSYASCKVCTKTIKHCGNTSNLSKHLKQHPNVNFAASRQKTDQNPKTMNDTIMDVETNTIEVIASTSTPSGGDSSSVFGNSEASGTLAVAPTNSQSLRPVLQAFKNIGSYSEGGHRYNHITNCLIYFICKDRRPFQVVNGAGFKKLMKEVVPSYTIPSATTLKKRVDDKYEVLFHIYHSKFQAVPHFSITCDIWSEMMTGRSFLGVTAHYLEGTSLKSICIATRGLTEQHTADLISEQLGNILASWSISVDKVVSVVIDNGSNMVSAVNKSFGKNKHLPCFAHTINLVATSVTNHESIAPVISKVREIVKWAKASIIVSDKIGNMQLNSGIAEGNIKRMVLDVRTRWNSAYFMLNRFVEMASIIGQILLNDRKGPPMATAAELNTIKQLIILLKPLEFVTRETSGENYVTVSKIIPMISCLEMQVNAVVIMEERVATAKKVLLEEIKRRLGRVEQMGQVAIATLLDPRFKNLHFQDDNACTAATKSLRRSLTSDITSSDSESDCSPSQDDSYDFWSHHKLLVDRKKKSGGFSSHSKIKDEVAVYLDNPVTPLHSDPIKYWEEVKGVFPLLYKQAGMYYSIVATSERLFSKVGATINQERNRLLGRRLEKLLFLAECKDEEWF